MKKIWVILLAAMMALAVCLTASVADEAQVKPLLDALPFTIADRDSYTFAYTDNTNSAISVKNGDTEVATFTYNNRTLLIQSGTLTVKTDETILTLEKDATFAFDKENKVITLAGNVTLSTNEPSDETIEIDGDGTLTLSGVEIESKKNAAGIWIKPKNKLVLILEDNNVITGGPGYAGIEVGWENGSFASLVVSGNGSLKSVGGFEDVGDFYKNKGGAGIGGSEGGNKSGLYGNITIESGTIIAKGADRASGIGSTDNPNDGGSHGSYKHTTQGWGTITINGGSITAEGTGNGAGIGSGNHVDSGIIEINGGTIVAKGESGIGSGLGSSGGADKGPGYYCAYITINGGNITAYATNNMGAGIGGGEYCDAYITINGGTVNASVDQSGNAYQGGAGIGGGYQGAAIVNITGGEVHATGGHGAPGIGNGALASKQTTKEYQSGSATGTKDIRTGKPTIGLGEASVNITGGYVEANGGKYGAGIGTGNASEQCNVSISGGQVVARGYKSTPEAMNGAAGIGSGVTVAPEKLAYEKSTNVRISITDGNVLAVGGWGAAGIGSGAKNKPANTINISGGEIEAYADGTKFAIDTRSLNADGSTSSITAGRNITRDIVQGTFVHNYEDGGISQRPEGLKPIFVAKENDNPNDGVKLTRMPDGYRSFATSVDEAGTYTVYTDSASIGEGGGRYFAEATNEKYNDSKLGDDILFDPNNGKLSDNFYLFPVKTIVVSKEVEVAEEDGADRSGLNGEFSFALWSQAKNGYVGDRKTISIVNGVPQNKAYFVNIPDGQYDITEMNGDTPMMEGSMFSGLELRRIRTRHGAGTDNDGVLIPDQCSDAVTVINTFGSPWMSLSGVKTWNDGNNQDGIRPAFITVNLLADGAVFQTTRVTPDASGAWRYSFENLPKRNGGNPITYTVSEEPVPGYTAKVSGMDLNNTHIPETVNISGIKTWNDADNQDGIRPAFITVNLLADGAVVQKTRVTPDASGVWRYSFENLPGRSGGNPITYTVSEEPVAGYTAEVSGYNLINTHVPETIDITGVKIWNDADNQDGIRPANIQVNLLANGTQIRTATVTGTTNGWNFTFEDLPRFEGGAEIAYTVTETPVAGYTTAINGTTITNTHVPEVVTISGTKTWNDADNQDGIRPAFITVNLLSDGAVVRTTRVTPDASGAWRYSFENLPGRSGGNPITYTVSEEPVAGYTAEASGTNLINTHIPETIDITGVKIWNDADNQDGIRPANIRVNLLANGTQIRTATVTGTTNRWNFTFDDLPRFEGGAEIAYTVTEAPVAGYTTAINGTTITNTHVPEVVTISGTKTWNDDNNEDGIRPDSITVNLLADGRKIDSRTVLGSGSYTFENLNRYERGREIRYTIEEEPVAGYTAEVSGYNLINTHVPERVEISGTKTWADHDNRDGLRPQSVTVNLMADGTQAASQTVTGEGNVWSFSFTNLPGYRNGRRIVYTVTENPVAEYETSIIGTNIYNIHQSQDAEPERYTVTIRYWADGAKAFPDYNGTYNFGEEYDVTSPAKPGYTVDKALVAGIVYENTVIDVYYTPNTVKLSVFYQYLDGSIAADPHFETLHAGDRYSVVSPVIEGYTASIAVVEGTMPGQDLQVIVWYRPDTAEENEGRVPLGDGTTMITEYGVPLGLGDTNRNAGECYD